MSPKTVELAFLHFLFPRLGVNGVSECFFGKISEGAVVNTTFRDFNSFFTIYMSVKSPLMKSDAFACVTKRVLLASG